MQSSSSPAISRRTCVACPESMSVPANVARFMFPWPYKRNMARWTKAVRQLGKLDSRWSPDITSFVCERHFMNHELVETHVGCLALVKEACPRIPILLDPPSNKGRRGLHKASKPGAAVPRSRSSAGAKTTVRGPKDPPHDRAVASNPPDSLKPDPSCPPPTTAKPVRPRASRVVVGAILKKSPAPEPCTHSAETEVVRPKKTFPLVCSDKVMMSPRKGLSSNRKRQHERLDDDSCISSSYNVKAEMDAELPENGSFTPSRDTTSTPVNTSADESSHQQKAPEQKAAETSSLRGNTETARPDVKGCIIQSETGDAVPRPNAPGPDQPTIHMPSSNHPIVCPIPPHVRVVRNIPSLPVSGDVPNGGHLSPDSAAVEPQPTVGCILDEAARRKMLRSMMAKYKLALRLRESGSYNTAITLAIAVQKDAEVLGMTRDAFFKTIMTVFIPDCLTKLANSRFQA